MAEIGTDAQRQGQRKRNDSFSKYVEHSHLSGPNYSLIKVKGDTLILFMKTVAFIDRYLFEYVQKKHGVWHKANKIHVQHMHT